MQSARLIKRKGCAGISTADVENNMKRHDLNGEWKLRILGEGYPYAEQKDGYCIPADYVSAKVPGTVFTTYVEGGMMLDPFYRENELEILQLSDYDFEYVREFAVTEEQLSCDKLLLVFEGIDTLADIYLNDTLLDSTNNMHCRYEYDVLQMVQSGENTLRVVLHSPVKYIREENEKVYAGGSGDAMEGYPHLRKAHCMFGWDW